MNLNALKINDMEKVLDKAVRASTPFACGQETKQLREVQGIIAQVRSFEEKKGYILHDEEKSESEKAELLAELKQELLFSITSEQH